MSDADGFTIPGTALERLPLFPFTNTVLFPNTEMPLNIFEPRYRQLMDDIIDEHRVFGLALLDESRESPVEPIEINGAQIQRPCFHPVAGLAMVQSATRLPDGRYNIIIRGTARIDISKEILEPITKRMYRIVAAKIIELNPVENLENLKQEFAAFFALTHRVMQPIKRVRINFNRKIDNLNEMERFIDAISLIVLPTPRHRQDVLGSNNLVERMRIVSSALGELLIKTQNFKTSPRGWGEA